YTLTFGGALSGFSQPLVVVAVTVPVTVSTAPATVVAGGGGTTVAAAAALEVQGSGLSIGEALSLSGVGFNNGPTGALRMLDNTPGTSETNTWTGSILLAAASAIGVDAGGSNPDTLTLGGSGVGTVSGTAALTKVGPGILELGGTSSNLYTGGTLVNAGTLLL